MPIPNWLSRRLYVWSRLRLIAAYSAVIADLDGRENLVWATNGNYELVHSADAIVMLKDRVEEIKKLTIEENEK